MDSNQIVLMALVAGRNTSDPQVEKAFAALKNRLLRAFGDNPKARRALDDFCDDPATYERPLAKALLETGAGQDDDVQDLAAQLLQRDDTQPPDILRQIAERESVRTGDRFTRRAHSIAGLKAQEEAASRQRMDRYWDEEFERRDVLAAQKAKQQQQERRMLIGVLSIAAVIVIVFLVIIVVTSMSP